MITKEAGVKDGEEMVGKVLGKENEGRRMRIDVGKKEFEVKRAKNEGEIGRALASDYNKARHQTKALASKEKADEYAFKLNQDRDFKQRMIEKRKEEAEERKRVKREEWEARREAKRILKEEEDAARRKQVEYDNELRRKAAELKEKTRLEKVRERRQREINKREEKRRLEMETISQKKASHEEFEAEWSKEKIHRTEIGKAKKVKDRVYKNLSRLNEETSLLDIPFGA